MADEGDAHSKSQRKPISRLPRSNRQHSLPKLQVESIIDWFKGVCSCLEHEISGNLQDRMEFVLEHYQFSKKNLVSLKASGFQTERLKSARRMHFEIRS